MADVVEKIKTVKQQLKEATLDAARLSVELSKLGEGGDPQQIKKLQDDMDKATAKAATLKDAIGDANDQIKVLSSGSELEKFGSGLGDVGSKLKNLDFGGAAESAKKFAANAKNLNPAALASEFKSFGSVITTVGKSFLSLGKAILANPLFLLAAIIIAIVVAVVKMKDQFKLVEKVVDELSKPFEFLLDILKKVTDAFGLTSFAAEDAATKATAANKKLIDSVDKRVAATTQALDKEIALARIAGEDTTKLELEKIAVNKKGTEAKLKGAQDELNALVKVRADQTRAEKAENQQQYDDLVKSIQEKKFAIQGFDNEATIAIAADAAEQAGLRDKAIADDKAARDKANSDAQAAAKRHADALKKIKDIELSLLPDGLEKEKAILDERLKRNQAEVAALQVSNDDKIKLNQAYLNQYNADVKAAEDKDSASKKAKKDRDTQAGLELNATTLAGKIALLQEQSRKELENLDLTENEKLLIKQKYQKQIDDLIKTTNDAATVKANAEAVAAAELAVLQSTEETKLQFQIEQLAVQRDIELQNLDLTESEKLVIKQKYVDAEQKLKDDAAEKDKQREKDITQAKFDIAKAGLDSAQSLTEGLIASGIVSAKKGFEISKGISIAQATISTIEGVTNALSAKTTIPEPFGQILKVANAVAIGAAGAANVAKIAATKFDSKTTPNANTPSAASPSAPSSTSSQTQAPSFNLFGQGNQLNNLSSTAPQVNGQQPIAVNVSISETEITSAQQFANKVRESATL